MPTAVSEVEFSVCQQDISKTAAPNLKYFHQEFWEPIYFGAKSQGRKNCWHRFLHSSECWFFLVSLFATAFGSNANCTEQTCYFNGLQL